MLSCGLQVSEAVSLRLEDVDIGDRRGVITVRSGKGGKYPMWFSMAGAWLAPVAAWFAGLEPKWPVCWPVALAVAFAGSWAGLGAGVMLARKVSNRGVSCFGSPGMVGARDFCLPWESLRVGRKPGWEPDS